MNFLCCFRLVIFYIQQVICFIARYRLHKFFSDRYVNAACFGLVVTSRYIFLLGCYISLLSRLVTHRYLVVTSGYFTLLLVTSGYVWLRLVT